MKVFVPPNVVLINISFNYGLEPAGLCFPSLRLSFLAKDQSQMSPLCSFQKTPICPFLPPISSSFMGRTFNKPEG